MYLKSMEIQGFKSFAKKTTLDFKNGITAIVGPNGSGKSNIADALRWVLGEQKVKSLRGSKMEDVIFAGTQKRNPLSFAYVAITFDNSDRQLQVDFSEVKVARKLYRSGESEYLLNGSPVRLKDVRELFYDTGIGKEGYSIIGQGQIDKILQGKSEERRELFDEACGIVKYKKRKTVALRKLENERLNLERTNDAAKELERRLGPLKRQSDAANDFITRKDELKRLELNLFLSESSALNAMLSDCLKNEEIASKELEENKNELAALKAAHEKASMRLAQLEGEAEELKTKISRAGIIKESLCGQINVLNEQINSSRKSQSSYQERKNDLLSSLKTSEEEKAALDKDHDKNDALIKELSARRDEISSELIIRQNNIAAAEEETENLKADLIENIRRKGETDARLERLKANSEQLEKKKEELELSVKNYLENSRRQKEQIDSLSDELSLKDSAVCALEAEAEAENAFIKDTDALTAQLGAALSALKLEEAKASTRLEGIRNITERYEGYSGAAKEVMALKPKKKGIIGVVADIIKVPREYETAIETALGAGIQNIVTDNENTAREAIEYLKANKLGRATFLPLNAVKSRSEFRYGSALAEEGAIGLACTLADVQPAYLDLCEYLLGRILVADNIGNALRIARKYRYSFIIVTLEGELLSRGGALSGGAYKNKSGLLGRRREIEELEAETASTRKKINETSEKLSEAAKKRQAVCGRLEDLNVRIQHERIVLNTLKLNLERARSDERSLAEGFESAKDENEKNLAQSQSIKAAQQLLSDELEENEKNCGLIKEAISAKEEALIAEKEKEQLLLDRAGKTEIELSRIKEQQSFIVSSQIKAENSIEKLRSDLKSLSASFAGFADDEKKREKEIEEIKAALKKADDEISSYEIKLADLEDAKEEEKQQNGDFIALHDELSEKISSLDRELFRLSQLSEKYEEQKASKADYIWHEYGLTYNSSLAFKDSAALSESEMKSQISELKAYIRGLGSINVSAIEEYKEVRERFDFLSGQLNDIKKAEEDILKIISDLDRRMKARFRSEFKKISAEFSDVFKTMFGGGSGTICLADENDILESDVEITAQPPGKKLQNMMQLSGGEKALTAIAVLFAIQNLKPSPFCILDEIEAALDDSNITRFANYLSLLSGKIQFIVITHRKGTMQACDRLYGITMQEKGVSSLISVSLEEAEQTAAKEENP